MAATPKPEFAPLLRPGFHELDLAALRRMCVDAFPVSLTRAGLMTSLDNIARRIHDSGIKGEIWVDGSFVTEKLNPDDVDFLLAVSDATLRSMSAEAQAFFRWFMTTSLKGSHKLDNYVYVRSAAPESEWLYAYWLKQFGFSRSEAMKGIAVVKLPLVVTP
jgi:hypothetical protein